MENASGVLQPKEIALTNTLLTGRETLEPLIALFYAYFLLDNYYYYLFMFCS